MAKPKVTLLKGSVTSYKGDAIIAPCDVELTNRKANKTTHWILENGNKDLIKELMSIGYCEVGNAVITKGHNLSTKHLIFMPYQDLSSDDYRANFVLLHQAFRSVFNLASLYEVKTLGMPMPRFKVSKRNGI